MKRNIAIIKWLLFLIAIQLSPGEGEFWQAVDSILITIVWFMIVMTTFTPLEKYND